MSGKHSPSHMASSKGKRSSGKSSSSESPRRREPLQDNYYYEEPRGGAAEEFEDVSSYSSQKRKKEDLKELERQKKKKGHKALKVTLIVLAVLILIGAGAVWYLFGYVLKDLTVAPITKNKEELGINSEVGEVYHDTSIKNIALFGLDAREAGEQARSDVIMILTVDNKHGKIKMTSILRDTDVSMKMTDSDGYTYYTDDKITHAHFWGGVELAVETLNRNFSLNIEDYVTVDFSQMAAIVDAVGGVDIELTGGEAREVNKNLYVLNREIQERKDYEQWNDDYDEDDYAKIIYTDYLENAYGGTDFAYADFDDGVYHLSGNAAVAYGRIRNIGNDDARTVRHQTVLKALIEKVRGKSKLEYPEIIRKLMPMCTTSLDFTDIMGMIPIMFTDFTIDTISVPDQEEESPRGGNSALTGGWVYLYDLEEAAKRIHRFIFEEDANFSVIGLDEYVHEVGQKYYYAPAYAVSDFPPEDEEPLPSIPEDNGLSSAPGDDELSSNPDWGDGDGDGYGDGNSEGDGDGDGDGGDSTDPNPDGGDGAGGNDDGGGGSDEGGWDDAPPNGEVNE
ncbi:MAG: LCP family protein [Acutalibacter sp.]|nr:LCP family protein [Acutalibacter sp.]